MIQFIVRSTLREKDYLDKLEILKLNFYLSLAKFDQLLKVSGKPLAKRVYSLITYIEARIFDSNGKQHKKSDPQADKAKVLRDTKFIPKLILRIENFNKFVMLLSKKSKNQSFTHYLHMGTVRDFRIKTTDLKQAIDETLTHSSQIECDESMIEEPDQLSDDDSDKGGDIGCDVNSVADSASNVDNVEAEGNEEVAVVQSEEDKPTEKKKSTKKVTQKKEKGKEKEQKTVRKLKTKQTPIASPLSLSSKENEINLSEPSTQASNESGDDVIRSAENKRNSESQILRNLEKVNVKTRKRKTVEKKKPQDDDELQPKNKRGRKSKN